ncbi:hypothetical protein Q427_16520 [Halomonas sp. BC04]|nr:hypothetical protein [Halomonas sp. BC04]EWH00976.1 hypothetical protein Q427_16520 [Halomonas sp. BC04]
MVHGSIEVAIEQVVGFTERSSSPLLEPTAYLDKGVQALRHHADDDIATHEQRQLVDMQPTLVVHLGYAEDDHQRRIETLDLGPLTAIEYVLLDQRMQTRPLAEPLEFLGRRHTLHMQPVQRPLLRRFGNRLGCDLVHLAPAAGLATNQGEGGGTVQGRLFHREFSQGTRRGAGRVIVLLEQTGHERHPGNSAS